MALLFNLLKFSISKMKTSILIFFLWLSATNVYAKDITLNGRVIDINNNGIGGATIQCFHHDSIFISGSVSNNDGSFNIKIQQNKDYMLVVTCIGYQKNIVYLKHVESDTKIGNIVLEETSVKLDDITVTAQQIVHTSDKLIIYPTKKQLQHSMGGYEVLYNLLLPELDVDPFNKKVTTRNREVTLCINGRKVNESEVQNLNADDILRINFYDIGTPAYPGADAVIDYILVQHEKGGNVTLNSEQHLNRATGDYNSTGQFFKKKSEFSYSISSLFDHQELNPGSNELIQFIYPDKTLTRKTTSLSTGKHNYAYKSYINYTYRSDKTLFYTSLRYNQSKAKTDNYQYQQYEDENSEKIFRDYTITSNLNPAIELFYDRKLNHKQSLMFSLLSSYNYNEYSYQYSETYPQPEEKDDIESMTKEKYFLMKAQITYVKAFNNKGTLSAMLEYEQNNTYKTQYSDKATKNKDDLLYSQFPLNVVYQQNTQNISLMLKWGSRYNIRKNRNEATIRNFSFHPDLTLNYQINDNQNIYIFGTYSETPQQITWLSKTEQEIDYLQVRRGNPHLKNIKYMEFALAYAFNWKWLTIRPLISHSLLYDALYETVFRENKVFVHSYYTGGTERNFFPILGLRFKLIPQVLTMKMDISYAKRWFTTWEKVSLTTWEMSNIGLVFMYKDFMATANVQAPRKSWGLGDLTEIPWTYRLNVGYNHHNLHLQIGSQNPFSRLKKNRVFETPEYRSESNIYIPKLEDHVFYLKASYRFNFGKQHEFYNVPAGNTNKSAILKAN